MLCLTGDRQVNKQKSNAEVQNPQNAESKKPMRQKAGNKKDQQTTIKEKEWHKNLDGANQKATGSKAGTQRKNEERRRTGEKT